MQRTFRDRDASKASNGLTAKIESLLKNAYFGIKSGLFRSEFSLQIENKDVCRILSIREQAKEA